MSINENHKIIFLCDRNLIHFFEDYINTFHHIFDVEIYLFIHQNTIKSYIDQYPNPSHHLFIFMQSIPHSICKNIQYYIDHQYKLCLFNTEQLSRKEYAYRINNAYHPYIYRMDYSEVNLFIVANELKKVYLPYQVHHREIVNTNRPKGNDGRDVCMIYPHKSERRHKIINELKSRGVNVHLISGFLGARDTELFQHKILLNIHFDEDYQIFEEMRCNRCIMNQMIVISEKSLYDDLHLMRRHFISVDYDQVVDKVIDVLINYELYHTHLFRSFDKLLPVYEEDLITIAKESMEKIFE